MKTIPTPNQKLVDWQLAFNSINSLQNDKALKGLIDGLRTKVGEISPGVS